MNSHYKKITLKQFNEDFNSAVEIINVPILKPAPNEILICNKYAGINAGFDTLACRNKIPYVDLTLPFDLGVEAIGEVVELGENVKEIKIGDAVVTTLRGGYCEYRTVDAKLAVKVREPTPEILTLMPTGVSALIALEQVGEMKSNETVLVTAAAGGTGHIAVQLAKLAGNHVIGTCGSEAKTELLKKFGCDRVINYRKEDVNQILKQEYPQGINLIFECVGKQLFDTCIDNLAIRGRLIVVGSISEYTQYPEKVLQPRIYHKLMWKAASIRGFLNPLYGEYIESAQNKLLDLFYKNRIKVAIDSTQFKGIESIPTAVEHLLNGKNCGKVVVEF
ncbi:alcohol dehydrogenase [Calothrix parasitica NIES-267]|uniref:Alcohol dehydrogenase n=1 Tax=Calothrix parasitica NIES-267 TaxID=1973488 RepID=A0A1Z4M1T3_9CYAN|nr:alcohol dehydrogenase [Calothrix parasitica NIES-267]